MIRLSRTVRVSTFDVEATVAVGRDRPEFLAVARLAADLNRPIGARDVLRELLGPRPDVLGWRVIERCIALGLLERPGSDGPAALSEAGRLALSYGEVLVPEEGIWRFFIVDDPLIPSVLIDAQRLEAAPVRKEREAMRGAHARGEPNVQAHPVPELLRRCRGAEPRASTATGHLFQLIELAAKGAPGPLGELRLELTWEAEPALRLSGRLPFDEQGIAMKPVDAAIGLTESLDRLSYETLWRMLVTHATRVPGGELERWSVLAGGPVVPVSFQALAVTARHAFRRDIEVPASEMSGLGRFEPTVLKGIRIVPASESDAQTWLAWLQWEAVNDYMTPSTLDRKGRELLALFPHHHPRPLNAADLLAKARTERGERSWYLLGPSDLGLWS